MLKKFSLLLICLETLIFGSGGDVYAVGFQNYNNNPKATLWITNSNGTVTNKLIGNLNNVSDAKSVTGYNQHIYIAGYQSNGFHSIATLWIYSEIDHSIVTIPLGTSSLSSLATSITYLNQKVYIAGKQNNGNADIATLWIYSIIDKSVATNSLVISWATTPSQADSITCLNQNIYIAGKQNNGWFDIATLWTYEVHGGSISSLSLASTQQDSQAKSLVAYKNNLYICGWVSSSAFLWIVNQQGSILKTNPLLFVSFNPYGAFCITSYNNTILVVGNGHPSGSPNLTYQIIWSVDQNGIVKSSSIIGDTTELQIFTLNGINGLLAAGVHDESNQNSIAAFWKTSAEGKILKTTYLGTQNQNVSSQCNGIYSAPILTSVIRKIQTTKTQRGT